MRHYLFWIMQDKMAIRTTWSIFFGTVLDEYVRCLIESIAYTRTWLVLLFRHTFYTRNKCPKRKKIRLVYGNFCTFLFFCFRSHFLSLSFSSPSAFRSHRFNNETLAPYTIRFRVIRLIFAFCTNAHTKYNYVHTVPCNSNTTKHSTCIHKQQQHKNVWLELMNIFAPVLLCSFSQTAYFDDFSFYVGFCYWSLFLIFTTS